MMNTLYTKILGCLTGGIIGDAMGAPVENFTYNQIREKYGEVNDFEGEGTDDSAIKLILCDAIIDNNGYVTADEFAQSFSKLRSKYEHMFYIPVKNMLAKVEAGLSTPVYAGVGNMQSSSSAMSISPMGIINAGNPRRASNETYDVAGLIHAGDTTFCRDAACAMAAAVAEAMNPEASVDSVIAASTAYLHKISSVEMIERINKIMEYAYKYNNYEKFRKWFYDNELMKEACDSRETVPVALAMFYLAQGDFEKAVLYAVNFGRDADTIGTMAGALAGAFSGADGVKKEWLDKCASQVKLAQQLYDVVLKRNSYEKNLCNMIECMTK